MKILAIAHDPGIDLGTYEDIVRAAGHELEYASFQQAIAPSQPLHEYGAVFILGGRAQVDQEDKHPWLVDEKRFIRAVQDKGMPTLGICFGGQLLAELNGAKVGPLSELEIGWFDLRVPEEIGVDPVFEANGNVKTLIWHQYAFETPPGAVTLARTDVASQAFRVGDHVWGVQFHPEISPSGLAEWFDFERGHAEIGEGLTRLMDEAPEHLEAVADSGGRLCEAFLRFAESRPQRAW